MIVCVDKSRVNDIEKSVAFRQVRDAGNLLTRAGFALPTVDVDEITVRYPSGTFQPQIEFVL